MIWVLRLVLLGMLALYSAMPVYAKHVQGIPDMDHVEMVMKNIMSEIAKGDMGNLFEIVDQHWHLPSHKTRDMMKRSIEQRKQLDSGPILGVEMINKKVRGESLVYFTFLEKYEHAPIYWLVAFYKPKDHWLIINISWAADIRQLLNIEGNVFD